MCSEKKQEQRSESLLQRKKRKEGKCYYGFQTDLHRHERIKEMHNNNNRKDQRRKEGEC